MPPSPLPTPAEGSPPTPADDGSFIDRIPGWFVPLVLLGVPAIMALLVKLDPDRFYDHFVFQYYWGPIKADAENVSLVTWHGITAHSGYNKVNTATWALLLGVCVIGLAQMLRKFKAPMDAKLIVGASLWVVAGSVFHVMEDTGLIHPPLQYLFITPPIYLLFGAFGIATFLVGQYLKRIAERGGVPLALTKLWLLHCAFVLGWLTLWLQKAPVLTKIANPLWVAAFSVITFLIARRRALKANRIDPNELVVTQSIGTLLLGLLYVLLYVRDPWPDLDGATRSTGFPHAYLVAPAMAIGATFLVWLLARPSAKRGSIVGQAFTQPINLLIVFAQSLDGFATALGIDLHGYQEKHVLSQAVIDGSRNLGKALHFGLLEKYPTFLGFAAVKLALAILVVYVMDVQSKKEAERSPDLMGLVKFAIIMVGLGPGIRDFLRLSLGV